MVVLQHSLRTRRLALRQLAPGDLQILVSEDPGVPGPQVSDAGLRWAEATAGMDPRDGGAWAIVHRLGGRTVGMVTYFAQERGGPAEISYMLTPRWRGKGVGSEAVGAVLTHLFETVKLDHVFADVAVNNIASNSLLKRLGFTTQPDSGPALTVGLHPQSAARWSLDAKTWAERPPGDLA
jgi:ribosomal-protein-alanine N-acetyltransferase